MARNRKGKNKWRPSKEFWVFLFLAVLYLVILYIRSKDDAQNEPEVSIQIVESTSTSTNENPDIPTSDVLKVHMINCGQGDAFLFEYNGEYAMIDCGPESNQEDVVQYLKKENVEKLQFLMGSHHHDDHMGGMAYVLDNVACDTVYVPKCSVEKGFYTKALARIKKYHIKKINPKVGDTYYLGEVSFNVIGQLSAKEADDNMNNYSTVVKVTYGEMDLIMTGDAEKKVEKKMIESGVDLDAEVLKMGHHGSDTSTSVKFLQAVSPDYALISCGVDNKYGHPCQSTMDNLEKEGVTVYRTDEMGDIIMTVTPNAIYFDKDKGDYRCGVIPETIPERMVEEDD